MHIDVLRYNPRQSTTESAQEPPLGDTLTGLHRATTEHMIQMIVRIKILIILAYSNSCESEPHEGTFICHYMFKIILMFFRQNKIFL
jgi:hypothetical protein